MTSYSFPSLGQTIRFAVDTLGILPRKRSEIGGLDETAKKRIQKKLQRLANEEGRLEENLGDLVAEVSGIIGDSVKSNLVRFVICETLWDVYETYAGTIKSDGTFLTEDETIAWFCANHAIPRIACSVSKHLLRANIAGQGLIYPHDEDWYLPTVVNGSITWPLAKVMRWVYQLVDVKQERFHYPNRGAEANHDEQSQNLENSRKWLKGANTPSWGNLQWTFSKAFDELAICEEEALRRDLSAPLRDNILCILFIARFSTDLCKRIAKSYGNPYLEKCITTYQQNRKWLAGEIEMNRLLVAEELEATDALTSQHNDIWYHVADKYWHSVFVRADECSRKAQAIMEMRAKVQDVKAVERDLIQQFGEYPARMCLSFITAIQETKIPDGFVEAFSHALQIKASKLTDIQVDRYESDLKQQGLDQPLKWVAPWLRAVIRYRNEDYEGAMSFAERAFNDAKYSAGSKQYDLVNLYVELAAKTNNKKLFKKGVEWSKFVGVQIRWLRDKEPNDANIDLAFEMLRVATYIR